MVREINIEFLSSQGTVSPYILSFFLRVKFTQYKTNLDLEGN